LSLFTASNLSAIPELGVVLGIMVIVHEFGHFAAAKLCKVRVETFAVGFGRKLFGFESGGTSYQLNLLPLGGYVKMAGELPGETNHSDDPGEFQNHPRWQRVLITLAGPIANFILAFALMTGLFMAHHEIEDFFSQPVVADFVEANSPAGRTGIQAGDQVLRIDTINDPRWDEVETRAAIAATHATPFSYLHDGKRVDTTLTIDYKGRQNFDPNRDLGLIPRMQTTPVQVFALEAGMPAAAAGLQPADLVLAIDGHQLHSVSALLAYLQEQRGQPVTLTVLRKVVDGKVGLDKTVSLLITPVYSDMQHGKAWRIGFSPVPPPAHVDRLPFSQALAASWDENIKNSLLIFEVLGRLVKHQMSVKALSSPLGIGVQVHQAFDMPGWLPIIETMAMISLNLGIFNLLPIPILDGGMIVFLAIESVIRRDLNPRIKERIYQVAFVCIVLFAAMVIFNDITKFLPVHPHP